MAIIEYFPGMWCRYPELSMKFIETPAFTL